jgi:hypothetical protein
MRLSTVAIFFGPVIQTDPSAGVKSETHAMRLYLKVFSIHEGDDSYSQEHPGSTCNDSRSELSCSFFINYDLVTLLRPVIVLSPFWERAKPGDPDQLK